MDNKQELIKKLRQHKYPIPIIVLLSAISGYYWLPSSDPDLCQVLSVYDGDTMTLQCPGKTEKTKVRFYCIDTPERQQKPWGKQAGDHLKSIAGDYVRLVEFDQDRYGRIVGEVYAGQMNLNLEQVKSGQAAVYDAYCKDPKYKLAEEEAKQMKKGIWAESGLHQAPWQYRKERRNR